MKRDVSDRLVYALSLIGILVVVHLHIMVGRGFDRGCFGFSEPTATVECEAVLQSDAGTLMGVSNAVWGLLFYLALVALSLAVSFGGKAMSDAARKARVALTSVGLLYSGYLIYYQATQIGAWCKLCVISASLVALLSILIALDFFRGSSQTLPMQSKKLFAALAGVTVLIAVVDLAYFSRLAVAQVPAEGAVATPGESASPPPVQPSAQLPAQPGVGECPYDPAIPAVQDYTQMVSFADPFLGTSDTGVQVVEYFDPNCPHCRTMHPILKRVIETRGDKAQFFMVPHIVFQQSLNQIEALYVAAQDGKDKYFAMIDAQFEAQKPSGLSIPELAQLAKNIGLDPEVFSARVNRGLNRQTIASRRQQVASYGLRGVPTVLINGRVIAGQSKTIACLEQMIDQAAAAKGD